ncbi:MAG TPA: proteasome subunit alpha [Thermoplasmata archaeon]|nr:proteasome subunit alpha [Thermoplasmata archaeon]
MAYDRASTVFSPDGRLFQVEYALQAIQMGGTAVAVTYEGGIVFVAYRNLPVSSLAEAGSIEKSFAIDPGLGCVTAGLIADSRVLVEFLRLEAQRHRITFGEAAPYTLLGHTLGTHLQQYTQFGGTRPFAVSLLLGGFSPEGTPGLLELDPSGATIGWKAYAIGRNRRAVADFLEEKVGPARTEETAFRLAVQAVAEGSPTPFPPEALDAAILEPDTELRRLPSAEVTRRVAGLPFIGTPDRTNRPPK